MPMYSLIEYSSEYSETTGTLWFYSKDGATNFNNDNNLWLAISNDDNFKYFKYKAKLLGNTEAEVANGNFRNATVAVPVKYLSYFWISFEIPLINCNVKLKIKWTKCCVLSLAANENNINENANVNNSIFNIKERKLYAPLVTLSARDNEKLSKRLSKAFEKSVYWNEFKSKSENENTTTE